MEEQRKLNNDMYAIRKRISKMKRELLSVEEYELQDGKKPLDKLTEQKDYFIDQIQKRENKIETLGKTYLTKIEKLEKEKQTAVEVLQHRIVAEQHKIERLEKEKETAVAVFQQKITVEEQKIEALDTDTTLSHLVGECSRFQNLLLKDIPKSKRRILLELEITAIEGTLKIKEEQYKEHTENADFVLKVMNEKPVVKSSGKSSGQLYNDHIAIHSKIEKQMEEAQKKQEMEEAQKKQEMEEAQKKQEEEAQKKREMEEAQKKREMEEAQKKREMEEPPKPVPVNVYVKPQEMIDLENRIRELQDIADRDTQEEREAENQKVLEYKEKYLRKEKERSRLLRIADTEPDYQKRKLFKRHANELRAEDF